MSSSCGTGRPAHLVAFAPGGGGGGWACPSCALARLASQANSASGSAKTANRAMFNCAFRN